PIERGHEEFWKEHLRSAASSHLHWQISALQLQSAINILSGEIKKYVRQLRKGKPQPSPQPTGVCAMLCGLMLENLFKAVLVSRTGAFNTKGEFVHKTHDLVVLANLVGLKLSEDESWLLERLTSFVEWSGRYPVPLSVEPLLPRTLPSGG